MQHSWQYWEQWISQCLWYAHGHLGKDNSSDSLAAFGNYVPFLNRVMKENPHFSEKLSGCGKFNQTLLHFQHLAFGLHKLDYRRFVQDLSLLSTSPFTISPFLSKKIIFTTSKLTKSKSGKEPLLWRYAMIIQIMAGSWQSDEIFCLTRIPRVWIKRKSIAKQAFLECLWLYSLCTVLLLYIIWHWRFCDLKCSDKSADCGVVWNSLPH